MARPGVRRVAVLGTSDGDGPNHALAAIQYTPTSFLAADGITETATRAVDDAVRAGVDVHWSRNPSDLVSTLRATQPSVVVVSAGTSSGYARSAETWAQEFGARFILDARAFRLATDGHLADLLGDADPVILDWFDAREIVRPGTDKLSGRVMRALLSRCQSAIVVDRVGGVFVGWDLDQVSHVPLDGELLRRGPDPSVGVLASKLALGYPLLDAACSAAVAAGLTVGGATTSVAVRKTE